jgi:hypothetical protein
VATPVAAKQNLSQMILPNISLAAKAMAAQISAQAHADVKAQIQA